MEIKVTSCADCPFREPDYWCRRIDGNIEFEVDINTIHPSCPLKQEPITVKLEENATN